MERMPDASVLKKRYYLIDSIRGLCVLGMILYHTLFDIVFIFELNVSPVLIQSINIIRDFGASCFIFISGMCFHLGSHNIRRSLLIFAGGLIVTFSTYLVMPDCYVIFGILTFMGCAGLIMVLLNKLFKYIPCVIGLVVSFVLFLLLFEINYGYIGFYSHIFFCIPNVMYMNYITAFFGFPPDGFVSGDYYPLLPWFFMYLCGYFSWQLISANHFIQKIMNFRILFLEKVGKYSLYIYLAHQPIIYGIIYTVFLIIIK